MNPNIKEIAKQNMYMKNVMDNLPGSIYWKNKSGVYLGCNKYAIRKLESVQIDGSMVGKTDYDIFSKKVADRYRKNDLAVMIDKKEMSFEEPIRTKSKQLVQLSTKRPMYNDQGIVIGVIGNTVDITVLKKIEDELRQAKAKAEQADIVKTSFITNMEHDIRTPVSGILGLSQYLYLNEKNSETKELLKDIVDSSNEVLEYFNQILDFSQIELGNISVINKKFKPKEVVEKIIKIEKAAIKNKKLTLNVAYDETIPEVILGDENRIHRILINLVSNAIKFTDKGFVKISVKKIKAHNKNIILRFIVEDTGIGIPVDKQNYIFEKFSKISCSTTGKYSGTGLGLKMVKKIMDEIGGEVDIISTPNKGTLFACTIPFDLPITKDINYNDFL